MVSLIDRASIEKSIIADPSSNFSAYLFDLNNLDEIKDLFKITNPNKTTNPRPNLIISPEEIANAQTATPLVTSSVGNPLTGIRVDTSFEDPKADQRRT